MMKERTTRRQKTREEREREREREGERETVMLVRERREIVFINISEFYGSLAMARQLSMLKFFGSLLRVMGEF